MNLSNRDPSIHFESVTKEVAQMFCQSYAPEMNIEMVDIDPSKDEQFPGIVDLTVAPCCYCNTTFKCVKIVWFY